ncbi:MAG: hypothetical protein ACM3ST_15075 [Bdellovibrio bacteriovorus]
MDRKIALTILGSALLGFVAVLLLIPPTIDDGQVRLPWRTTTNAAGQTEVFGFTLGETTLEEVRELFGQEGTINLFETPGRAERYGVEVYFEQVYLQSLRADFVVTVEVDQETLGAMYERGLRISQLGSGSKKVKLDPEDVETLLTRPIRAITYLPQARLDEPLIEKRFGTPAERRTETETGIVHWLYPDRGIDIARDPKGKVVIQYVSRGDFPNLLAPLTSPEPQAEPGPPAGPVQGDH